MNERPDNNLSKIHITAFSKYEKENLKGNNTKKYVWIIRIHISETKYTITTKSENLFMLKPTGSESHEKLDRDQYSSTADVMITSLHQ